MSHTTTLKQNIEIKENNQLHEALTETVRTLKNGRVHIGKTSSMITWDHGTITYALKQGRYVATIDTDYRHDCEPIHHEIEKRYKVECAKVQVKRMGYVIRRCELNKQDNRMHMLIRRV